MNFGKSSNKKLDTCHPDLQLIMRTAIAVSRVDFGIAEGRRALATQKKYFAEGKSKCDGVTSMSKHQATKAEPRAMAADVFPYVNGKADYTMETLSYLAGHICGVADMLFAFGRIKHKLRWGGNWDGDGEIITDQSFDDRPHFELINA